MNSKTLLWIGAIGAVLAFLFLRKKTAVGSGPTGAGMAAGNSVAPASTGTASYFPQLGALMTPYTNQLAEAGRGVASIANAVSSSTQAIGGLFNTVGSWFKSSTPTANYAQSYAPVDGSDYSW
jgi:hypothetical protein